MIGHGQQEQAKKNEEARGTSDFQIPKRWPLATQPDNRASSYLKDARLVNCYAERNEDDGGFQVEKRYGTAATPFIMQGLGGGGMYNWSTHDTTLVVQGGALYQIINLGNTQEFDNIAPVNITGVCRFIQTNNAAASQYVVFGAGTSAGPTYYFQGSVPVPITDPNFPEVVVPGIGYLDGTIYVMDPRGNIWGSQNFNDPTTWDPLNVIQAQASPEEAVYLGQQLTYIVAFKRWTTQFFYDAGNATGSPLGPVQGALLNYGCISPDTVQSIDGLLLWATCSQTESSKIAILDNLAMRIVSTPGIDRQLDLGTPNNLFRSFTINLGGHRLYGLTNITTNVTLVYDIDQHLWYQWTDPSGNYYPIIAVTVDTLGNPIAQNVKSNVLYNLGTDFDFPNDNGTLFPVDIYTPNFDAGVDRIKMLSQMRFNCDKQAGSFLNVRFSDDDYETWSNFRRVNLNNKRPMISDCGSFYRRAYHFNHMSNTPFRVETVDLQMAIGTL